MSSNDLHQLSGAYALNALDELERARYEHHLASCEPCRTEVDSFLATTARLGELDQVQPSPTMRDAVLGEVDRTRQVSPVERRVVRNLPRLASVAAGVLVVAVVGLSVLSANLAQRVDELEQLAAPVNEVLRADDQVLASVDVETGVLRVLAAPSTGQGVVVADDLPSIDEGSVYQLWLIDADGVPTSAGLLDLDGTGDADQVMQGEMERVVALGVTVEPAGGSEQPTTDPVALVEL